MKFYADAWQPRQPQRALLRAFEHERRAVLHVQAEARRPLLLARQQLHGSEAARVAREGARGERIGLEDRASSTIRFTRRAARTARTSSCAQQLEPLFLKYGVDVVLAGHEHFYERIKPQKGIYYFISGGAAKLREGDVNTRSELTAKSLRHRLSLHARRARRRTRCTSRRSIRTARRWIPAR